MKVNAKLVRITEGWHGQHHRRVAELEIQTKDSPFVGGKLLLEAGWLDGAPEGTDVTVEVTQGATPAGNLAS